MNQPWQLTGSSCILRWSHLEVTNAKDRSIAKITIEINRHLYRQLLMFAQDEHVSIGDAARALLAPQVAAELRRIKQKEKQRRKSLRAAERERHKP